MMREERSLVYMVRDGRIELEKALEQLDMEQDDLYFQLEEIVNLLNDIERELEEREEGADLDDNEEEVAGAREESFREGEIQDFVEDDYFDHT